MQRRRALEILGSLATFPVLRRLERLTDRELRQIGERAHDGATAGSQRRVLTAVQYRQVEAVAEHILPRTDTPGATDAKVANFIDVMLADWYTPAERDRFLEDLADLDVRARARRATTFVDLAHGDQLAIVEQLDGELATLRARDARAANAHWFGMLKFLTIWGYHTSRLVAENEERMTGRYDGNAPYRAANPS